MLQLEAISPKGRKLLRKHGNRWIAVAQSPAVTCLGMRPGVQLKSVRTRQTHWVSADPDHPDPDLKAVGRISADTGKLVQNHPSWLGKLEVPKTQMHGPVVDAGGLTITF